MGCPGLLYLLFCGPRKIGEQFISACINPCGRTLDSGDPAPVEELQGQQEGGRVVALWSQLECRQGVATLGGGGCATPHGVIEMRSSRNATLE